MKTIGQHPISFRTASFKERLFRLQSRCAFTLIELLVVIATIAVLAATLLPALAASQDRDRRAQCANNLRQICVATFMYASDMNDYMPPLKWRGVTGPNLQYPYEMARLAAVNTPGPPFDPSGGPYNLGSLWKSGVLVDGKIYYCPGDLKNDELTYNHYSQTGTWPYGESLANGDSNPTYIRSGYVYYPQSRVMQAAFIPGAGAKLFPVWPLYNSAGNSPTLQTWICVPLFKQTQINQTNSIVVDAMIGGLNGLSHKSGNTVLGLNAGFGDGHVAWQGVNKEQNVFGLSIVWADIAANTSGPAATEFQFVQSCWQP